DVRVAVANRDAEHLHVVALQAVAFAVAPLDGDARFEIGELRLTAVATAVAGLRFRRIAALAVEARQNVDLLRTLLGQKLILRSVNVVAAPAGDLVIVVLSRLQTIRRRADLDRAERRGSDREVTGGHEVKAAEGSINAGA